MKAAMAVLTGTILFAGAAEAQLLEVTQAIYGMD